MTEIQKPAVLIAGPTASGKSHIAMFLARQWNGVVVNADSMQVYADLRVLTARPSPEDEASVPHRLYGHVPLTRAYSAGAWLEDVKTVLGEIWSAGQLPVIVGGTGLYFKMLLEGVAPVPDIPEDIREYWRGKAERDGVEALHKILKIRDPLMAARLEPGDPQRMVRALEVLEATGRSLHDWQKDTPSPPLLDEQNCMRFVIAPPREALYERIDARFDWMLAHGGREEAARIAALGLPRSLPAMKALGLKQLLDLQAGDLSEEGAMEKAKTQSRRYAKRQMTWLKSNMISWNWIDAQETTSQLAQIFAIIR
ncbi:MAG: tRNA (adenosine(37)-N6)-dimethylallyltransferase MiaA [Hyphomicrobiales bacterium]|nr:MAG: tRNA (adenosine(37)-N6)-dimethylallyltransferase MiaA [Hyphomicrobiales bacterium]